MKVRVSQIMLDYINSLAANFDMLDMYATFFSSSPIKERHSTSLKDQAHPVKASGSCRRPGSPTGKTKCTGVN